MKAFFLFWALLLGHGSHAQEIQNHKRIACTAIRDHSNSPTYGFELIKQSDGSFHARYLNIPGKEGTKPEVVAFIDKLKCRFLKKPSYLFQCEKFGASVESIRIYEDKMSLSANKVQRDKFREFRAVGTNVPGHYLAFRFGDHDICVVQ